MAGHDQTDTGALQDLPIRAVTRDKFPTRHSPAGQLCSSRPRASQQETPRGCSAKQDGHVSTVADPHDDPVTTDSQPATTTNQPAPLPTRSTLRRQRLMACSQWRWHRTLCRPNAPAARQWCPTTAGRHHQRQQGPRHLHRPARYAGHPAVGDEDRDHPRRQYPPSPDSCRYRRPSARHLSADGHAVQQHGRR
jgi:hypothetical protein